VLYDLIVFDMAGTTVHDGDSVASAIGQALRDRASLDLSRETINSVMGLGTKRVAIAELLRRAGVEPMTECVDSVYARFAVLMEEYYRYDPAVREVEGVGRLFAQLRAQGVRVGLDTAFSRTIGQTIVERLGWLRAGLFDAICSAEEVRQGRPAPYMIFHLMESTGVTDVRRVAKVGDTPSDLEQGHNAGCGGVFGVAWGSHSTRQLEKYPHARLLESPSELWPALGACGTCMVGR
jgi:phosphonatase-like hydrolase